MGFHMFRDIQFKEEMFTVSMVVHTCNLSTWETEAGGLPQIQLQSSLHSELPTGLGYRVRPCSIPGRSAFTAAHTAQEQGRLTWTFYSSTPQCRKERLAGYCESHRSPDHRGKSDTSEQSNMCGTLRTSKHLLLLIFSRKVNGKTQSYTGTVTTDTSPSGMNIPVFLLSKIATTKFSTGNERKQNSWVCGVHLFQRLTSGSLHITSRASQG